MKKAILYAAALTLLTSLPAQANIIIEPMIVTSSPPTVILAPAPVYVTEPIIYPVHIEHHHHYDWRYWHARREHEEQVHEGYEHR